MKIQWRAVMRDALAVLLLSFLGQRVWGWIGIDPSGVLQAVSVLVLMTVGFCVSACLVKQARFKHLGLVAAGVWLIGTIVRGISGRGSFVLPLPDLVLIVMAMLLGGLISLAIVRMPPAGAPPASPPPASPPPA